MYPLTCSINFYLYENKTYMNYHKRDQSNSCTHTQLSYNFKLYSTPICAEVAHSNHNFQPKKKVCVTWLNHFSLAVTLLTNVNSQKFYMVLTLSLCVVYGSQNKQRLLSHTTLTELFHITEVERVYCAVHLSPHIKKTRCIFRGLIKWVWMANDMSVEKCMSR